MVRVPSPPQSRSKAVVCVSTPRMYLCSGYFLVTLWNGLNPISHGRWSWRLPVYSNHQLSNKDRAAWQKTWWQYGFKYPTYFGRISFIFHYQIVGKFWIWKCSAKNFLIFHAFFINLWSRGKHSWLWILWSRVQISVTPFLFHRENCWCHRDSNTGP